MAGFISKARNTLWPRLRISILCFSVLLIVYPLSSNVALRLEKNGVISMRQFADIYYPLLSMCRYSDSWNSFFVWYINLGESDRSISFELL